MSRVPAALTSARAMVMTGCLLLISLPLFFLAFAYGYETLVLSGARRDLTTIAQEVTSLPKEAQDAALSPEALGLLGRRGKVLAFLIGRDGSVLAGSGTAREAMDASLIGSLAERLLGSLWAEPRVEDLDQIERELGPLSGRAEVHKALAARRTFAVQLAPSGHAVLVRLAVPLPDGKVLYLSRGSKRGLRQLLLMRHELLKVILYQSAFALLLGGILNRRLLYPLSRLARAARRYPEVPLGDPQLLARKDELGELARSIRALADDLEARRAATADLGADVAHEFKNPLATIAASVELLGARAEGASPERVKLVAEHIEDAVGRLRRSLDALLSLLRLEATLRSEPREPVDYAELLSDILDDYRRDPRYAGFTLRAECAPEVGTVRIVPHRWEELLRNLLDNALVQPMERREVVIRASRTDDGVLTTVRDFGPGVSPGNRDKIFRRFFTQRPDGAPPGTGLGLSIVQAVAAAHGGQVTVGDPQDGDGPGALFAVTLSA